MSNKIPQLVTPEELCELVNFETREGEADFINTLLESKMKYEHCQLSTDGTPVMIGEPTPHDTHHIYYITQEIEPEVEECEHAFMCFDLNKWLDRFPERVVETNYCPKCGENLNEKEETE